MAFDYSYMRILNRLGYYDYQHGLIVRHLNQGTGWESHLNKCKCFINKSIELYKPEKVTVLGSGWLLELPLEEMLDKVNKICLIDIVHPPEVRRQVVNMKNVELITEDITGGLIDEIWQITNRLPFFRKLKSLSGIVIPEYKATEDPGMVISLNILTQLETLPVRRLLKRSSLGEPELISFRKEIQDKHLDFLKRHKSLLITDVTEIFTDKSGTTSEKMTLLTDLPKSADREDWTWDFDLLGSDYVNRRSVLKVAAMII